MDMKWTKKVDSDPKRTHFKIITMNEKAFKNALFN